MTEPLNRKALYDLVWKKPMVDVAKEYGLSDRGLAKLYERNGIPVPPRGYWAKKHAGYKVIKPPLIVVDPKEPDTVLLLKQAEHKQEIPHEEEKKEPKLPPEIQEAMDQELLPRNQVRVQKTLANPHPIVAKWIEDEAQKVHYYKKYGNLWSKPEPVSSLERRSRRIISAFLRALEARGFEVEKDREYGQFIWITHQRDRIGFSVTERIRQHRRELTPEEKKDHWNPKQKWKQISEPSGELLLRICEESRRSYGAIDFRENSEQPLETQLNQVIAAVIEKIWWTKKQRLEREEAEHQRWERQKEEWHQEELRKAEQARRDKLVTKAEHWKKAKDIREYVAAVEKACRNNELILDPNTLSHWINWALAYANELDPIISGRPLMDLAAVDPDADTNEDYEESFEEEI